MNAHTHRGCAANTKGTAFVVYEDIFDAKNACEHLSGFNVCNRYLVVLYYQPHKVCAVCICVCVHICNPLRDNPAHPAIIDFVLEAIIVTKQHFGENAVITATGQQTHGLQDIRV